MYTATRSYADVQLKIANLISDRFQPSVRTTWPSVRSTIMLREVYQVAAASVAVAVADAVPVLVSTRG